jgi:1-acyl-sn-glycerol-3-phosphate acyltransferase
MRPEKLSWAARLRSNLLHAPPFLLSTALFGTLALLASLFEGKPPQPAKSEERASKTSAEPAPNPSARPKIHGVLQHRLARRWARSSIRFSGSRLQVIGLENIPRFPIENFNQIHFDSAQGSLPAPKAPSVYAGNHTSYMDTPVIFAGLPFQFRILAKKELWPIPFIGWYLNRSGQIPIDTENPRATLSSLGAGVRALRQGLSVYVFPEGGRTPDGHLQPFLNGAAYLAIRAQVPLVPVALIGVYDLLPIHTRHFYHSPQRHPLKLIIGAPIPTTSLTIRNADQLTAQLKQSIADLIQQHS